MLTSNHIHDIKSFFDSPREQIAERGIGGIVKIPLSVYNAPPPPPPSKNSHVLDVTGSLPNPFTQPSKRPQVRSLWTAVSMDEAWPAPPSTKSTPSFEPIDWLEYYAEFEKDYWSAKANSRHASKKDRNLYNQRRINAMFNDKPSSNQSVFAWKKVKDEPPRWILRLVKGQERRRLWDACEKCEVIFNEFKDVWHLFPGLFDGHTAPNRHWAGSDEHLVDGYAFAEYHLRPYLDHPRWLAKHPPSPPIPLLPSPATALVSHSPGPRTPPRPPPSSSLQANCRPDSSKMAQATQAQPRLGPRVVYQSRRFEDMSRTRFKERPHSRTRWFDGRSRRFDDKTFCRPPFRHIDDGSRPGSRSLGRYRRVDSRSRSPSRERYQHVDNRSHSRSRERYRRVDNRSHSRNRHVVRRSHSLSRERSRRADSRPRQSAEPAYSPPPPPSSSSSPLSPLSPLPDDPTDLLPFATAQEELEALNMQTAGQDEPHPVAQVPLEQPHLEPAEDVQMGAGGQAALLPHYDPLLEHMYFRYGFTYPEKGPPYPDSKTWQGSLSDNEFKALISKVRYLEADFADTGLRRALYHFTEALILQHHPPAALWDLQHENARKLDSNAARVVVEVISPESYFRLRSGDENHIWHLVVTDLLTAVECLRRELHSTHDMINFFLRRGTPFAIAYEGLPNPLPIPPDTFPSVALGFQSSPADFEIWETAARAFLDTERGRLVWKMGGIYWRIALYLRGTVPDAQDLIRQDVGTIQQAVTSSLFEEAITGTELGVLIGMVEIKDELHPKKERMLVSYFPTFKAAEGTPVLDGMWTPCNEEWFLGHLNSLRHGTVGLLSQNQWRKVLRSPGVMHPAHRKLEKYYYDIAEDLLDM